MPVASNLVTRLISPVLAFVPVVLLPLGAALVLAGTMSAWAQVTLFRHIDILLPGWMFAGGGVCLASAVIVLLGARRCPLLCLALAVVVLAQTHEAERVIPLRVKSQLVGAQMAAYPVNRLLDQFHLPNMEVASWGVPNAQILGAGLRWAIVGGEFMLLGALCGLPSDPAILWTLARTRKSRCTNCGERWLRARNAHFCPSCGIALITDYPRGCAHCGTNLAASDRYCIACGTQSPHLSQ